MRIRVTFVTSGTLGQNNVPICIGVNFLLPHDAARSYDRMSYVTLYQCVLWRRIGGRDIISRPRFPISCQQNAPLLPCACSLTYNGYFNEEQ